MYGKDVESSIEAMQQVMQAIAARNFDRVDALTAPTFVLNDWANQQTLNRQDLREVLSDTAQAIPDATVEVVEMQATLAGQVVTHFTLNARDTEGVAYTYHGIVLMRVADGQMQGGDVVWEAKRAAVELARDAASENWRWPPWKK